MKKIYFIISLLLFLSGCTAESFNGISEDDATGSIRFTGFVKEEGLINTRTLDSLLITSTPYSGDFYIEIYTPASTTGDEEYSQFGTYIVPAGYEGILNPKSEDNKLMWPDLNTDYTFYAWTFPTLENHPTIMVTDNMTRDGESENDENNDNNIEIPTAEEIPLNFYNSPEGEESFNKYHNNDFYETFIGAVSGPYSYARHGKYVDLTFRHLVSKIEIEKVVFLDSDGSTNEDLQYDIIFLGMPDNATFYPHPENDDEGNPVPPYVEPGEYQEDGGLTFFINNKASQTKVFYIPPELDFSRMGFKININETAYGSKGDYYGSFNDVVFERKEGEDWDQGENIDSKILHAGEKMKLQFLLIPGVGPGVSVVIEDWSTVISQETVHQSHKGIYTDAELMQILETFWNQEFYEGYNTDDMNEDKKARFQAFLEQLNRFKEQYGEDENNNIIFPLFENIDISGYSNGYYFPVYKDVILDGMGHQIKMKSNSNNWFNHDPYFNVGQMRDIYLTDGTNSIYIDEEGFVWIQERDADGQLLKDEKGNIISGYIRTKNQLTPLDEAKAYDSNGNATGKVAMSYNIDAITGKVVPTSYYNDRIGS